MSKSSVTSLPAFSNCSSSSLWWLWDVVREKYSFTVQAELWEPCFDALHLSCPSTLQLRYTDHLDYVYVGYVDARKSCIYRLGWMRPCDKLPINWCGATGFQPQHLLHCSTQSHVMPQYTHQSFRVIIAFRPHLTNILAWTANSTESHGRVALTVQVKDGNQVGSPLVSHGVGQVAFDLESPWVMRVEGRRSIAAGSSIRRQYAKHLIVVVSNWNLGDLMVEWWKRGWMMDQTCLNYGYRMVIGIIVSWMMATSSLNDAK